MNRFFEITLIGTLFATSAGLASAQDVSFKTKIKPFLDSHCVDCHGPEVKKAGLRLDLLKPDFADTRTAEIWTKVHDRIAQGQMPPPKRQRPPLKEQSQATQWLNQQLHAHSRAHQEKEGRVALRRLNGTEYENTLRDLLAVNSSVKALLPEENVAAGFDNISAVLEISAGHLLSYQQAAEKAILAAIPIAPQMAFSDKRTGKEMVEKSPLFKQGLDKFHYVAGNDLVLPARLPDHYVIISTALSPQKGRYRITASAYATGTQGRTMPIALMCRPVRERGSPELRIGFDVPENKPTVIEAEFEMNRECHAWLSPWALPERYDFFLKKVPDSRKYDGPKLVVEWIKMEGPIGDWPPESYRRLFKDVPLKPRSIAMAEAENKPLPKVPANAPESYWQNANPLIPASAKPKEDAERLIRDFLPRALRRPVSEDLKKHYVKMVHDRLADKYSFLDAMVFGYKAILTSTDFLYFLEPSPAKESGTSARLDDHAIANRLSYFLWSSLPDAELRNAADKGGLSTPTALRAQVERMLNDPKAHRFTENFTGQWLDLRRINDTMPNPQLYGEFDQFLYWSMPRETELFFEEILKHDRSLCEFVDSDWSMLNERLAQHYGIEGVVGQEFRKVKLPAASHRGGVMTHASVLKVTADGTRTSPVLRGKWVLERIVGKPPAPPPPDIPLFEPDIRGATTIREQLDKHRNTPACATCHNHIDPPGFALENFDPIGGWREFYRASKQTKKGVVKGKRYFRGPDVEVGGVTPDGKAFKSIDDYKKILLEDKDQLARNLTIKVMTYATGADIQFADREVVEQIVAALRARNFGFRELIHQVVQSRVFLSK